MIFYGICPRIQYVVAFWGDLPEPLRKGCAICNVNAPSEKFLRLANSSLYHFLKTRVGMRGKRKSGSQTQSVGNMALNPDTVSDYEKLRAYYEKNVPDGRHFHFNSSQTEGLFRKYLGAGIAGKTINITTSAIYDRRSEKQYRRKQDNIWLCRFNQSV